MGARDRRLPPGVPDSTYSGLIRQTNGCMRAWERRSWARILQSTAVHWFGAITCWILLTGSATAAPVHRQAESSPPGIAWQVKGLWKAEGQSRTISTGDFIVPGSLLHPEGTSGIHSILIFLPDGQRIHDECYLAKDCARNFRVPKLYHRPDLFAVELLARIHQVLVQHSPGFATDQDRGPDFAPDEALAVLGAGNEVRVAGLAAALPNGDYTYNLEPLNHNYPRQENLPFEKKGPSIILKVPATGVYDVTIFDRLRKPRINLFLGAVKVGQTNDLKSFSEARALMERWNDYYQGWPLHVFRRAYLESLLLDIRPHSEGVEKPATAATDSIDTTAEPMFSPRPGVFDGDTSVTLTCSTPGAIMHYTVDGSQPLDVSPVYAAPIIVKGTELTIKSFAAAPGKKDSAVVTGIFRIRE